MWLNSLVQGASSLSKSLLVPNVAATSAASGVTSEDFAGTSLTKVSLAAEKESLVEVCICTCLTIRFDSAMHHDSSHSIFFVNYHLLQAVGCTLFLFRYL